MIGRLAVAILLTALPLGQALAQADHAQRIATELAQRRAQIRAALCQQREPLRLPTYPPVGSGGKVAQPACPSR